MPQRISPIASQFVDHSSFLRPSSFELRHLPRRDVPTICGSSTRSTGINCFAKLSSMPSFDIVSEVDKQEIDNALKQARKELATRFEFKGSVAASAYEK